MADERKETEQGTGTGQGSGQGQTSGQAAKAAQGPPHQGGGGQKHHAGAGGPAPFEGDVTIEISCPRNRSLVFQPTKTILRGRWRRSELFGNELGSEGMDRLPDPIPGLRITLDGRRKTARIFDPLEGEPELLKRVSDAIYAMESIRHKVTFEKAVERKDMNETDIKTWLHWMRRALDQNFAFVVSGSLPTEEQIKALPGKTRCCAFSNDRKGRKFKEETEEEISKRMVMPV